MCNIYHFISSDFPHNGTNTLRFFWSPITFPMFLCNMLKKKSDKEFIIKKLKQNFLTTFFMD